ncbi:MAG TPA: hypothetical protein VIG80_13015, partial [Bacillaceae bacterium]
REVAGRPLVDRSRSWTKKSGGALLSPDKHKANHAGGPGLRNDLTYDLQGLGHRSWTMKSGRRLLIGDKHKEKPAGGPDLRKVLTYDLETMAHGAGQRKAEGACLSATV